MEAKKIKGEELSTYIEGVILKNYPKVGNREETCCYAGSPEIEIRIRHTDNQTNIFFLNGSETCKVGDGTRTVVDHCVEFGEIEELIDFLLNDHRIIKGPYTKKERIFDEEYYRVKLPFYINWCNDAIPGINCRTVILAIFFKDKEKKKQFVKSLSEKYADYLENTRTARILKEDDLEDDKKEYFGNKPKKELMGLINEMDENDLVEMLCGMSPEIFTRYFGKGQTTLQENRHLAKEFPGE